MQKEIEKGLLDALVLIYVASENSVSSHWMEAELQRFLEKQRPVIPIVIDDDGANNLPLSLRQFQWADFRGDYDVAFQKLVEGIRFLQQPGPIKCPKRKSKGYVFVSCRR